MNINSVTICRVNYNHDIRKQKKQLLAYHFKATSKNTIKNDNKTKTKVQTKC